MSINFGYINDPVGTMIYFKHYTKIFKMNYRFTSIIVLFFTCYAYALNAQASNVVNVNRLADLPAPVEYEIRLDSSKAYFIHGNIHIGKNYISLNGASLQGRDPGKDRIISACKGAVLRSRGADVYLEKISVLCADSKTMAYDFRDDTNSFFCNIFQGCSVLEPPGLMTGGVGKISGFNTTCIDLSYWNVGKGLKVGGKMNKFTLCYTYVSGIRKGAAVELTSDAQLNDIVLTGNYFIYGGSAGVKVNRGTKVKQGRMTLNLFNGQSDFTIGFNSFTPGWEMISNSHGIPDSRASANIYMNDNETATEYIATGVYRKIEGETTAITLKKFDAIQYNQLTYIGNKKITIDVVVTVTGISSYDNADLSIALMKNGSELILPKASNYNVDTQRSFQMRLDVQVDLDKDDYIEVFLKADNNTRNRPVLVKDLAMKVVQQY